MTRKYELTLFRKFLEVRINVTIVVHARKVSPTSIQLRIIQAQTNPWRSLSHQPGNFGLVREIFQGGVVLLLIFSGYSEIKKYIKSESKLGPFMLSGPLHCAIN